ncbi:hypothetical protein ACPVPU_14115 [Sphingomonas sp. CJ99]
MTLRVPACPPAWTVQSFGALMLILGLGVLPPAEGAMLIVPVGDADVVAPALDAGAALVDLGPLPGSIIVHGRFDRLAAGVGGALILRAPRAGCEAPR